MYEVHLRGDSNGHTHLEISEFASRINPAAPRVEAICLARTRRG